MKHFVTLACVLSLYGAVTSAANASSSSIRMEQGVNTLLWLRAHPKPGTPHSRSIVRRYALARVVSGMQAVGTYWALRCIHPYEGSWNDTHNPKYDGGLQMDSSFQWGYGPRFAKLWGRAYNWPPWAQLVTATRAVISGRGYSPWPTTRRYCHV